MATKRANKSTTAKKVPAKATAKPLSAKKSTSAKKASAKKTTARSAVKTVAKKAANKSTSAASRAKKTASTGNSGRKYSPAAADQVRQEMHEMHRGQLKIGKSNKKVTDPKQAIAIGLAEARRAGKKVPPNPNDPKKR